MARKIRVGVLFGGRSSEHEISLLSAKSVIDALDPKRFEPVLVSIDKTGAWQVRDVSGYLDFPDDPKEICLQGTGKSVALVSGTEGGSLLHLSSSTFTGVDVVFPVLHGMYGEDGTVQGLLRMAGIPFVGADVLGSAVGMDKDVMKRLLKEAGLPIAKFRVIRRREKAVITFADLVQELGLPLFIKPANAGSSVGVSKVRTEEEYEEAVKQAFSHDSKILVEECVEAREIECSVLGNEDPIASLPGEVIPQHEFYSYEAKYLDEQGARFEIPVSLPASLIEEVQRLAVLAFQALCCEGMARVDFFLTEEGRLLINEINTIPGFTKISMYPKLWEVSGLPYKELLSRLIELALEREATRPGQDHTITTEKV